MGLFGKLFEKKYCDICGGEIGLLGNRKLEDGNCCKNCAAKLSPWFDDRRHSTIQNIKDQLQYREENKTAVSSFTATRTFGESFDILMIDENTAKFCVGSQNALRTGNPDIVDITAITSAELEPVEHKTEVTFKDKDGKTQSYNPKRYQYSYDFYYDIKVNHPWFDGMRFRLNSSDVELPQLFNPAMATVFPPKYTKYTKMGEEISYMLNSLRSGARSGSFAGAAAGTAAAAGLSSFAQQGMTPELIQEAMNQAKAKLQGTEQTGTVTETQSQAATEMQAPSQVSSAWKCAYCGTQNEGGKFCSGCGAARE